MSPVMRRIGREPIPIPASLGISLREQVLLDYGVEQGGLYLLKIIVQKL